MRRGAVATLACAALVIGCTSDSKAPPTAQSSSAASSSPMASDVTVHDGIVYGHAAVASPSVGDADLLLDLYEPASAASASRPVVVLVHGGGFTAQSRKDDGIVRIARGLAQEGIVAASIDYRLQDQQPVPSARVRSLVDALAAIPIGTVMATAVDDTLTAVDYLRAHAADLGIDIDRLGLVGSSAGAITVDHLAYVLDEHGVSAPKVRFVASLWGAMFVDGPSGTPVIDQVNAGEPSLFAVHGDADPTLPVQGDDDLVARAQAVGITTEYQRIAGGGHGFTGTRFFIEKVNGDQTPFDRLLAFAHDQLQ